jgi:hypothetical protein
MVLAAVAGLGQAAFPVEAKACPEVQMVQGWYAQYLHRPVDPCGLDNWVRQLRCGMSPECVQAAILGSEEYWCAHGHNPKGFVLGLYADVLGRTACEHDVHYWACRLQRCGCRKALAKEFLCAARRELAGPPIGVPGFGPGAPNGPPPGFMPAPPPGYEPAPSGVGLRVRYVRR